MKDGKIIPIQSTTGAPLTKSYETERVTLVVNRDDSNYAEGFIMVDDGLSQTNFIKDDFTYWKLRFAEKALNFWVELGDFTYNVTDPDNGG